MYVKRSASLSGRKPLRAKQETPLQLLYSLALKPSFVVGPGDKERGWLRAQQLDTNVHAARSLVDESLIRANL